MSKLLKQVPMKIERHISLWWDYYFIRSLSAKIHLLAKIQILLKMSVRRDIERPCY